TLLSRSSTPPVRVSGVATMAGRRPKTGPMSALTSITTFICRARQALLPDQPSQQAAVTSNSLAAGSLIAFWFVSIHQAKERGERIMAGLAMTLVPLLNVMGAMYILVAQPLPLLPR